MSLLRSASLLCLGLVAILACSACRPGSERAEDRHAAGSRDEVEAKSGAGAGGGRLTVGSAMASGSSEGFARALEPREFDFPDDHGPHPGFRTEWWYLTGNLVALESEQRFGYQLTFFRSALRPPRDPGTPEPRRSAWRSDELYMAHFALTDVADGRFHPFERFSRGAIGLAGARTRPLRVWLDDWELRADSEEDFYPLHLRASEGGTAIELTLEEGRAPTLQGDRGLSRKGSAPGNASYYYSLTRLPTAGTVTVDGRVMAVGGSSWMDREWSTSALDPGVVGWDWFALQLSDGRDVMLYRLRRSDGTITPESDGSIVEADGARRRLGAAEVDLSATDEWVSAATGATYPSAWRLVSAPVGLDLRIEPLLEAQEHTGTITYWEGAVSVEGSSAGQRVTGSGYVELTGYESDSQTGSAPGATME